VLQDPEHPDLTALLNLDHPVDSGYLSARAHSPTDWTKTDSRVHKLGLLPRGSRLWRQGKSVGR
jgi:hypothetical protein